MAENCMRTSISVSDYHTGIGHRNANLLLVNQTFHFWDVNYHTVTHYIQKPTVFCSHILPSGYQTWQRGNHQFIILSMILFQLETSIFFQRDRPLPLIYQRLSARIHVEFPLWSRWEFTNGWTLGSEATILDDYVINCYVITHIFSMIHIYVSHCISRLIPVRAWLITVVTVITVITLVFLVVD